MKNFIITLTVLIGLTSCSKTDAFISAENCVPVTPVDTTTPIDTTPVIDTSITYYFNIEIPYYNINLTNLAPYQKGILVENHDIIVGYVLYYRDIQSNTDYTVFFEFNQGITRIWGNGFGHAFGTTIDLNHINVCNGPQNIPVFYSISTTKITH